MSTSSFLISYLQQNYQTVRRAAADYMKTHPDEFIPFLPPEEIEGTEGDGVLSPGRVFSS